VEQRACRIVIVLTLLLWVFPAVAGTVAIIRPTSPAPQLTETLFRLHGELLSVGLDVKIINTRIHRDSEQKDLQTWLKAVTQEGAIDAVIEIIGDTTPLTVHVWIVEKSTQRYQLESVTLEPDTMNASEKLAIRAIEVLRSSFLESDMATQERRVRPIEKAATTFPPNKFDEPARHSARFGFEGGASALTSLDGVGFSILPTANIDLAVTPSLLVQATLVGLGSRPTVATEAGYARVAQQYGLLGGAFRFHSDQLLWPFFALSAGVLHTAVEGQADSPKLQHTTDRWSFLMDASLGVGLRLPDRCYITLASHLQLAEPYVAIHIMDTVVATTGRPNLALTLTVGVWL
jgi:hypothetical protein